MSKTSHLLDAATYASADSSVYPQQTKAIQTHLAKRSTSRPHDAHTLTREILLAELHSARDALGRAIQFAERMEVAGTTTGEKP
jgi:hypothetical protein